jgi:hypothetical protein
MKKIIWRFLEILPGALVWLSFIAPVLLSFIIPSAIATYILLFDLYWLFKMIIIANHLIQGYRSYKEEINLDWVEKNNRLLKVSNTGDWRKIYHAVMLAMSKESFETLDASVAAVTNSDFPLNRVIMVIATEQRYPSGKDIAERLKQKYAAKFYNFLITEHPDGIVGEFKAKGANATWAAKKLKKYLEEKAINFANVLVTTADADSRLHNKYLSCLTYKFLTQENRVQAAYQPITFYSNNIWHAPAISRIIAFGNSFWQMIESTRPWRMLTFATHSMSFQTLVDINYWEVACVNEDSRQFWRGYFRYNGNFAVVPISVPVYMDAVLAENFWKTLKNQYLQKQRWAYGIEHFPYLITSAVEDKKAPFIDKWVRIWREFDGKFSWATASIYIAVMAWLPLVFGPGFRETVLGVNLMKIIRSLMMLTWAGILLNVWMSLLLLPPRPLQFRKRKFVEMVLQWVLVPIQAIIFSSIPAIDTQTRLMLGKYIGFRVTEKKAVD